MRQRRGGCDTQPPLQRAWLSSGGTRFAKERTIADRAATKQCLVTFMCGNAPWSVRAPLSGSPRRSAASPPCADEGHQFRSRRPPAHQLQRRGPDCQLLTHTPNRRSSHSDRGTSTFVTMRRLRHPIEWPATFFLWHRRRVSPRSLQNGPSPRWNDLSEVRRSPPWSAGQLEAHVYGTPGVWASSVGQDWYQSLRISGSR